MKDYSKLNDNEKRALILEKRLQRLENMISEDAKPTLVERYRSDSAINEEDESGVIKKVGNKWKILKKDKKSYWDADYDTKADAQAALRAYWANKN